MSKETTVERFIAGSKPSEVFGYYRRMTSYGRVSGSWTRVEFVDQVVKPLEIKYGMPSDEFMNMYRQNKLDGYGYQANDFMRWAQFYKLMEENIGVQSRT